jgi:hypothetical protein
LVIVDVGQQLDSGDPYLTESADQAASMSFLAARQPTCVLVSEAHAVMMGVRSGHELEAMAWELLLGASDHAADAPDPLAGRHRVEIAGPEVTSRG